MPEIVIALLGIVGFVVYIALIWGLVVWSKNRYKKQHQATQKDISDAELFRLMNRLKSRKVDLYIVATFCIKKG